MCPGMSSRQSNYECVQQVTQLHNLIAVKQAAVKTSNFPRSFLLDSNESLLKGSQDPPPHDLSLSLSLMERNPYTNASTPPPFHS